MSKNKIVSVTFNSVTPQNSLLWINQVIMNLLIKELDLTPREVGSLVKSSYSLLKPLDLSYQDERKVTDGTSFTVKSQSTI